jgi:hypothetical protein
VRLTTSLQVGEKYLGCVVCRFHVAAGVSSAPCQKPVSINLWKWFISPTGRLNLGFLTEGNLIIPSSWGSQLVVNATHIKLFSGIVTGEKEDFCKGSLSLPIFFTLLLFCLVSLLYFCLHIFFKNTKRLVPFIVVIFVYLF